jgi:hypothetical protein
MEYLFPLYEKILQIFSTSSGISEAPIWVGSGSSQEITERYGLKVLFPPKQELHGPLSQYLFPGRLYK